MVAENVTGHGVFLDYTKANIKIHLGFERRDVRFDFWVHDGKNGISFMRLFQLKDKSIEYHDVMPKFEDTLTALKKNSQLLMKHGIEILSGREHVPAIV